MARSHIHTIITKHFKHWPVEAIMASATRPPTLRILVRIQRDARTFLHGYKPLPLSNPIADTIRTHFQSQHADLRARLYHHNANITDPINAHTMTCSLAPHTSPSSTACPHYGNTVSPIGLNSPL
jgi:hypothetical protein